MKEKKMATNNPFIKTGLTREQVLESLSGNMTVGSEQRKVECEYANCDASTIRTAIENNGLLLLMNLKSGVTLRQNAAGQLCYNKDADQVTGKHTWFIKSSVSSRFTLSYSCKYVPSAGEVGVTAGEYAVLSQPKVTITHTSSSHSSTRLKFGF